ncbi:MAG: N-acetylmuramoyl-L-alanine amidase [Elusimicrobia bacterium]|nr:N-acetylmuramoyl-L-alanine amidase [Elusimicrobiota bacterium]
MFLRLLASLFLSHASAQSSTAAPSIRITYPTENMALSAGSHQWVIGCVTPPAAALRINGQAVKPHRTGGFIAYLPVSPGSFTFRSELELSSQTVVSTRTVFVPAASTAISTTTLLIDPLSLQPGEDVEARPGDWLNVQMRATPDSRAEFQIRGIKRLPLIESPTASGFYRGTYQFQPEDDMESSEVTFHIKGTGLWSHKASAKGRVTVRAGIPRVAVVGSRDIVNIKAGPNDGYLLFPPAGTKFLVTGRQGGETKVQLSPSQDGWVSASALQMLPAGTPPPRAVLGTILTQAGPDSTSVLLGLTDTIPYSIEASPRLDSLTLRLYYTTEHSNWIVHDSEDRFIQHIRWRQEDTTTVAVTVQLNGRRRLWGYSAAWEGGSLRLQLRHPPQLPVGGPPLKGRTVVLDPGHMPSAPGAAGPCGTLEKDANLAIAKTLEGLLKNAGADVVATRAGDDEVGLAERPRIAREGRGDIFVSIHNNNIPDGTDPFDRPHGYSVFYYHPQSISLARAVHRAYRRRIPLPDEQLRYGNLLVARLSDMPAILVESAYMNYPEQEELLNSPSFRAELATAMLEGIQGFFEEERRRQKTELGQEPAPAAARTATPENKREKISKPRPKNAIKGKKP